jgi:hypothetical protein
MILRKQAPQPKKRKGLSESDPATLEQLRRKLAQLRELRAHLEATTAIWRPDVEVVDVDTFWREFMRRKDPSERQREMLHAICGTEAREFPTQYTEAVAMWGQKGGKNWIVEGGLVYTLYKLLCLVDAHSYFGVSREKTISLTNSSLKGERQAKEVFFDNVKNTLRSCIDPKTGDNWFERYAGTVIDRLGVDVQTKSIYLPNQNNKIIQVHSFDSTADAPEGLQILWGIMDEPSRACTPPRYADAVKLRRVIHGNGIGSVGLYHKTILFSYPEQEVNDLTYERFLDVSTKGKAVGHGFESANGVFVMKAATWEVNPNRKREDYQSEYDDDPIEADCRFGANVKKSRFGFFQPYPHKIRECADPTLVNRIVSRPTLTIRHIKSAQGILQTKEFTGMESSVHGDDRPRVFAGDPALSGDSFVFGGGYLEQLATPMILKQVAELMQQGERVDTELARAVTGAPELMREAVTARPVFDCLIVWEPTKDAPVDYLDVDEFIMKRLLPAFPNTRGIYFDRYQSESLRQRILSQGIESETYHSSRQQQLQWYRKLRRYVWNNMARLLNDEKSLLEAERLIQIAGGRVDHPSGGCFTGDTKVALADGRNLSFKQLVKEYGDGQPFYVYSLTKDNRVVAGVAKNPRLTHRNVPIVAVTLDNGEVVRCTPDHLFANKPHCRYRRRFQRAQDIGPCWHRKGRSLTAFYRKLSDFLAPRGYEMVWQPGLRRWVFTHRAFCKGYKNGQGNVVHHKNFTKFDNRPTNFAIMPKAKHDAYHNELGRRRALHVKTPEERQRWLEALWAFNRSARGRRVRKEVGRRRTERAAQDPAFHAHLVACSRATKHFRADVTWARLEQLIRRGLRSGSICKKLRCTMGTVFRAAQDGGFLTFRKAWEHFHGVDRHIVFEDIRRLVMSGLDVAAAARKLGFKPQQAVHCLRRAGFAGARDFRAYCDRHRNHRVVSVRPAGRADVYDLTVETHATFGLTVGCFVHNSNDRVAVQALWMSKLFDALAAEGGAESSATEADIESLIERCQEFVVRFRSANHRKPTVDETQKELKIPVELATELLSEYEDDEIDAPIRKALFQHSLVDLDDL